MDVRGLCGSRLFTRNIDAQVEHECNHRKIDQENRNVKKTDFVGKAINLVRQVDRA